MKDPINNPNNERVGHRLADQRDQDDWNCLRISTVGEMATVIETVVSVMAELEYPPKVIFGTRLALEEAICNSLKHGHRCDPNKVVKIRYRIRADHVLVEVEDQGAGFDPSQIADATASENLERPCGRGLLLMRHYAAWVRHNRAGNRVIFCICRSTSEPDQLAMDNTYPIC